MRIGNMEGGAFAALNHSGKRFDAEYLRQWFSRRGDRCASSRPASPLLIPKAGVLTLKRSKGSLIRSLCSAPPISSHELEL
jgi:hypothetical protein